MHFIAWAAMTAALLLIVVAINIIIDCRWTNGYLDNRLDERRYQAHPKGRHER